MSYDVREAPGVVQSLLAQFLGLSDADVARRETRPLATEQNLHQHPRELAEVGDPGATPGLLVCSRQGRAWEPELANKPPGHPHPQPLRRGDRKLLDRAPGSGRILGRSPLRCLFSAPRPGRRWSLGRLHRRLLSQLSAS